MWHVQGCPKEADDQSPEKTVLGQDLLASSQWSYLLHKISSERNIPKPLAKIFSPRPASFFSLVHSFCVWLPSEFQREGTFWSEYCFYHVVDSHAVLD